ncbi:ABC transporter permease subunit [Longimicrobium terrae]|uniref:Polar amino acid transport system substrate-binding protein n=1 Tax=Longimicrobium terrae TaxID=1639882 RepID=A0A841GV06_9BACT|nr:polar amino acid transport system substrate-binding protein [Longimicrobium terrae]MBB6069388.1 polar amino acid transport system substrate-binding protein [Longimicrobium terrae]NNC31806.1 ABC transporter permease subunit [Longimicrobium terrae]
MTEAQTRPPFRWGGDAEGGAPFVEADAADPTRVRGFDVEIAEMIARGLGREPVFVQVAWASLAQSAERGDYEIGLSGVEDRPELRTRHALTIPYFEFQEVLAVRPADRGRFRTLADLAGRRVATLGGTMAYDLLLAEQARTGLVPVSYDDDVHPYTDLVAGRVDAVLLDDVIAARSLRRTGGFVIQPQSVAAGHYVGVMASSHAVLRDSVDDILRARMADGSLERTFRAWGVWSDAQAAYFERVLAAEGTPAPAHAARQAEAPARNRGLGAYLPALARAAGITLLLSCLAMALAVALGIAVAAGRVYGHPVVRGALAVYVEVVRGTPVLLQLFVLYYGLSGVVRLPAFAAAVLGLGLNYAAYESEIYRAALQAVPRTQLEAARTLGLSEGQILRLIRGPQALRLALAPMTNDFVALLKDSSLVSVITVVELTKQTAIYATNAGSWVVPGIVCSLIYLAFSLPLSRAARMLERRWSAV